MKVKAGDRVRFVDGKAVYTVKSVWSQEGKPDEVKFVKGKLWHSMEDLVIVYD